MIKACVNWIKPKLEDEFCEYFENEYTQKYFKSKGLEFKNPEELSDFLRQGKLITICLAGLARAANITLSSEAFEKDFSDPIYANSYKTMVKDVCEKEVLTLPAPILIQFGETLFGFAGNRRINLAKNQDIPLKIWLVIHP